MELAKKAVVESLPLRFIKGVYVRLETHRKKDGPPALLSPGRRT